MGYVILGRVLCHAMPCRPVPRCVVLCRVLSTYLPGALAICGIAYLPAYLRDGLGHSIGVPPPGLDERPLVRERRLPAG